MTTDLADTLDSALEQLGAGQSLPAILADHPAQAENLAPLLEAALALQALRPVEMPPRQVLVSDRNDFLALINQTQAQPVSPGPLIRLKEWIAHQMSLSFPDPIIQRKEQRRMSTLLLKATLIFSLFFGSTGGAVALAANSLPDSPLYPAKLAMEQARLNLASGPAEQAGLHLNLAQNRVQEMVHMALAGDVPEEDTLLRLNTHLNQAFNLAARLGEGDMGGLLNQAQQMIQAQEQELSRVQARVAEPAQEPLRQAIRLLNQARQDVEEGLRDPETFRWRHTENRPPEAPAQPTPVPGGDPACPNGDCEPVGDQNQYGPQPDQPGPGAPGGNPDCPNGDCEPAGDQHQYGPQPDQAGPPDCPGGNCNRATDRVQNGPQPDGNPDCPSDGCEPVGDQNQYGPQPDQPGPGEPGGNPGGDCANCQPEGDQNQYGPQPDQPGPGEPGGNPDGDCSNCQPAGDQNQYGPQPDQPGPGEPGGNPGGDCTDCQPEGDEHHHGSESDSGADDNGSPDDGGHDNGGDGKH